jgi:hypothetical protein
MAVKCSILTTVFRALQLHFFLVITIIGLGLGSEIHDFVWPGLAFIEGALAVCGMWRVACGVWRRTGLFLASMAT